MSKNQSALRGKIAELVFDRVMLEAGAFIARPLFEGLAFDRLLSPDNCGAPTTWRRVQIKRTYRRKDGSLVVNTVRTSGERYARNDADVLAAVDVETGEIWLIPWRLVYPYTRKVINERFDRFKAVDKKGEETQ